MSEKGIKLTLIGASLLGGSIVLMTLMLNENKLNDANINHSTQEQREERVESIKLTKEQRQALYDRSIRKSNQGLYRYYYIQCKTIKDAIWNRIQILRDSDNASKLKTGELSYLEEEYNITLRKLKYIEKIIDTFKDDGTMDLDIAEKYLELIQEQDKLSERNLHNYEQGRYRK